MSQETSTKEDQRAMKDFRKQSTEDLTKRDSKFQQIFRVRMKRRDERENHSRMFPE